MLLAPYTEFRATCLRILPALNQASAMMKRISMHSKAFCDQTTYNSWCLYALYTIIQDITSYNK